MPERALSPIDDHRAGGPSTVTTVPVSTSTTTKLADTNNGVHKRSVAGATRISPGQQVSGVGRMEDHAGGTGGHTGAPGRALQLSGDRIGCVLVRVATLRGARRWWRPDRDQRGTRFANSGTTPFPAIPITP